MKDKQSMLSWQQNIYDTYMVFRRKSAGCAPSTERTIHAAIFSFFDYMNRHGIISISDVSAFDLKDWHVKSKHTSVRARNLYTSQLRIFFEYLADKGIVTQKLPLALTGQCAAYTSNVEILTEAQIERIERYRIHASTPMELRNIAIVLLGLRLGIRSVDICKLKISDVSWKNQTISFIQQKTGIFISLPMPTDVGNSLYRYITEGRPINRNSSQIFLSHMPPYHGLKRTASISRSMQQIFHNSDVCSPRGFHITRRTFASNMLRSGNSAPIIASALGHTSIQNIDPYLSTDTANLRLCAISCENIEYGGRYGL